VKGDRLCVLCASANEGKLLVRLTRNIPACRRLARASAGKELFRRQDLIPQEEYRIKIGQLSNSCLGATARGTLAVIQTVL